MCVKTSPAVHEIFNLPSCCRPTLGCTIITVLLMLINGKLATDNLRMYWMDNRCGTTLNLTQDKTYAADLLVFFSPSIGKTKECILQIHPTVKFTDIAFFLTGAVTLENACLSVGQGDTSDRIYKIKGAPNKFCANNLPPTDQTYTTSLGRSLFIKYKGERRAYVEMAMRFYVFYEADDCGDDGWCENGRCIPKERCEDDNPCFDNTKCKTRLSAGQIAGIVVGVVLFVFICGGCALRRRYCSGHQKENIQMNTTEEPDQVQEQLPERQAMLVDTTPGIPVMIALAESSDRDTINTHNANAATTSESQQLSAMTGDSCSSHENNYNSTDLPPSYEEAIAQERVIKATIKLSSDLNS